MKRALIVGCGYVGTKLAKNLYQSGVKVTGIRRTTSTLPEQIKSISLDVSAGTTIPIASDTDVVFYLVAPSQSDEASYRSAYIDGLKNTLHAAEHSGVKRFIFVSSSAVYHQNDGSWVDETSPTKPQDYNGKIMLEAESILEASSVDHIIVRFSGIYGPGRNYFIEGIESQKLGLLGYEHYSNRIHRDDCAGILQHVAGLTNHQTLYLASDELPTQWDEFVNYIAEKIGVVPKKVTTRPRSSNKRCSSERIIKSGYRFKFPTYREGYSEVIKAYLSR